MPTLDYAPTISGVAYDPADNGGAVSALRLYDNPDRAGDPVSSYGPAERVSTALYRFTLPDGLIGRFWTQVEWTKDSLSDPFLDSNDRIDLPYDPSLLCSPEDVATKLAVALPLTGAQREAIIDEIRDCQADVESYLNRSLFPTLIDVVDNIYPYLGATDLTDYRSWPQAADYDDKVTVLATTAHADGSYQVTFQVGLDAAAEDPIVRFVRSHTVETLRDNPDIQMGKRLPTSISAEGQSVSYSTGRAGQQTDPGKAGAVPNVKMLSRYRRVSVHRRRTVPDLPWPYRNGPTDL